MNDRLIISIRLVFDLPSSPFKRYKIPGSYMLIFLSWITLLVSGCAAIDAGAVFSSVALLLISPMLITEIAFMKFVIEIYRIFIFIVINSYLEFFPDIFKVILISVFK